MAVQKKRVFYRGLTYRIGLTVAILIFLLIAAFAVYGGYKLFTRDASTEATQRQTAQVETPDSGASSLEDFQANRGSVNDSTKEKSTQVAEEAFSISSPTPLDSINPQRSDSVQEDDFFTTPKEFDKQKIGSQELREIEKEENSPDSTLPSDRNSPQPESAVDSTVNNPKQIDSTKRLQRLVEQGLADG